MPRFLIARAPDQPFPPESLEALYAAVLIDDRIDDETALPDAVHLDYSSEQLTRCFRLCRQLWKTGVDRAACRGRVRRIDANGWSLEDLRAFKEVRAKFKLLRCAFADFDARHRSPWGFHVMTVRMGHLQDALKNGQTAKIRHHARLLRLFLSYPFFALVWRETDRFQPATAEGFERHILGEVAHLRDVLSEPRITSKHFHETRKIISRQVALFDCLRTLYPSAYHHDISRYLSAINGMMGRLHDDLVQRGFEGVQDYHADTFPFPDEIRRRIAAYVERFAVVPAQAVAPDEKGFRQASNVFPGKG